MVTYIYILLIGDDIDGAIGVHEWTRKHFTLRPAIASATKSYYDTGG
jgi:hypothetical protein